MRSFLKTVLGAYLMVKVYVMVLLVIPFKLYRVSQIKKDIKPLEEYPPITHDLIQHLDMKDEVKIIFDNDVLEYLSELPNGAVVAVTTSINGKGYLIFDESMLHLTDTHEFAFILAHEIGHYVIQQNELNVDSFRAATISEVQRFRKLHPNAELAADEFAISVFQDEEIQKKFGECKYINSMYASVAIAQMLSDKGIQHNFMNFKASLKYPFAKFISWFFNKNLAMLLQASGYFNNR